MTLDKRERGLRIHLIYCAILILISILFNYDKVVLWFLKWEKGKYLIINQDADLINPNNRKVIGELRKGAMLRFPDISDLDDTDLGDNVRFKILIDIEAFENRNLRFIDENQIFTEERNAEHYDRMILKPRQPMRRE